MKSVSQQRHRSLFPSAFGGIGFAIPERSIAIASKSTASEPDWQRLVYERAPLAYLNFDTRGRIVDCNAAAARLLGIGRVPGARLPLANFFTARHLQRLRKHIAQSRASRVPVTTRLQLRAQNDFPATTVEMSTRPVSDTLPYRTQLLPISGNTPIAWPADAAKFRALVENSSEVVCIGAPDGTVFYTTPSVKRVLGYEPASWFGRNAFEIMKPEQAPLAREAVRQLATTPTGTVIRLNAQVRHFDGSWIWVEAVLTNLIGQAAIGGIVCNYRDITDSRRAEESLRDSEHRYRLLTESLPHLICIRDEKGRVLFCNSHWCAYRGISAAEAKTYDWTAGAHPDDLKTMTPPPWVTGSRKQWEGECRIRRASDGVFRWHIIRVMPLPEQPNSDAKWLAIASDIHERKQVEQERERLLAQIESERSDLAVQYAVVRTLEESLSLADAAPRLLAAFCDQLGWQAGALWTTADSARGRLSLVHIRQQPPLTRASPFARSQPAPVKRGQGLAGRVWEKKVPLSLSHLSPRRGPVHHRAAARLGLRHAFAFPILLAGDVRGVVELFTRDPFEPGKRFLDIVGAVGIQIGQFIERTYALERLRQSEEALIQVNNALELRVSARTAELHKANRELSAEIVERTRLEREIIRVSEREQHRIGQDLHDGVCQELAAIALMTRALANRLARSDNPETARINRVARLLNDSISRTRNIARGLHPVEMDTNGLMVALKDLALRTHQTIACSFRCDQPMLMPESDMALNLYRIAQEAVNNAIKYSHAGRIVISLGRDGPALRLSISDDGRGIPTRAGGLRGKRGGMGLHIMHYRARTMGATLRIHDRRPHGTEVVCLLPRQ